jgi:hypothetical protein
VAPHWLILVSGPKTWGWCTFFHFLLICQFIVALLHQSDKNGTKIEGSKMLWRCYIEMDLDIFDFDILFVCGAAKSECKFAWPSRVLPHMKVGDLLSPP